MAVTATYLSTILTVTGDATNRTVVIDQSGANATVTADGSNVSITGGPAPIANITRVSISAGSGGSTWTCKIKPGAATGNQIAQSGSTGSETIAAYLGGSYASSSGSTYALDIGGSSSSAPHGLDDVTTASSTVTGNSSTVCSLTLDDSGSASGNGTITINGATTSAITGMAGASNDKSFSVSSWTNAGSTITLKGSATGGDRFKFTSLTPCNFTVVGNGTDAQLWVGVSGSSDNGSGTVTLSSGKTITYSALTAVVLLPAVTVNPSVTGNAVVGDTLTCGNGTWSGGGTQAFAYQWQQDTAGNGTFANISGQTAQTLSVVSGYLNNQIRCRVTCTNEAGSSSTVNTSAVGPVGSGGSAQPPRTMQQLRTRSV